MAKEIKFNAGKNIYEMACKPLRSRKEAILLLLYTIRMFDVEELTLENVSIKVAIAINKMNRIFYILEDKIFSMQFPFCLEICEDKVARIYDAKTGLDMDSMLVSALIGIFQKADANSNYSLDNFLEEIIDSENILPNVEVNQLWEIVKSISTYDLGYLRYDYDEEHKNGVLHPLNHLDIFLDTGATYKIGLEKRLSYEKFKDILDITTNCFFLNV